MQVYKFRKNFSFMIASCVAVSLLLSSCGAKEQQAAPTPDAAPQVEQVDKSAVSSDSAQDSSTETQTLAPADSSTTPQENNSVDSLESKLIASIPERSINMYGLDNGVELHIGDLVQQYDWIYSTPRMIEPRLAVKDYDADGHDELAIILYIGSGTGVSVEQLHMIEMEEDPKLQDHVFSENDYLDQVNPVISFKPIKQEEELIAEVTVGSNKTEVIMKNYYNHDEFGLAKDKLGIRDIVGFGFDDNKDIKASFGIGVLFDKIVSPQYIGSLNADVSYHDGQFKLSNYAFDVEENI